jgi:hypothetical protein
MIAVDTSTWVGFRQEDGGEDAELLDRALQDRQVLMVPVVLAEGFSVSLQRFHRLSQNCRSSRSRPAIGSVRVSHGRKCWQSAARRASTMH